MKPRNGTISAECIGEKWKVYEKSTVSFVVITLIFIKVINITPKKIPSLSIGNFKILIKIVQ